MRRACYSLLPVAALVVLACNGKAQNETSRQVSNGGVSVSGWTGQIDPGEARRGQTLSNAKLDQQGTGRTVVVRLENDAGDASGWFRWAHVGPLGLEALALRAGMRTERIWSSHTRWFAEPDGAAMLGRLRQREPVS